MLNFLKLIYCFQWQPTTYELPCGNLFQIKKILTSNGLSHGNIVIRYEHFWLNLVMPHDNQGLRNLT